MQKFKPHSNTRFGLSMFIITFGFIGGLVALLSTNAQTPTTEISSVSVGGWEKQTQQLTSIQEVVRNFGEPAELNPTSDVNNDGTIDIADIGQITRSNSLQ